jgi:signal transduction histidine kinase
MGERVEVFGGTFEIHSSPGTGTRLEGSVPLHVVDDSDIVAV